MSKKLYFNWSVIIVTEEAGSTRQEALFYDKQEITEEEMLAIFKNKCAAPKTNDPVGNLEGDLGSSHMQGTPKAQGHEADNLSEGSAR